MARLVMKFGGTSVADIDRIRNVAQHVKREVDAGHEVAVVVSAMAGTTNRLVDWCREAAPLHDAREYDAVVASGEQAERLGRLVPDQHPDEHATCYIVRGRGLVVISSCGHVGLINTIRAAMAVSGVGKLHAVLGGFHLGPAPQDYVAHTVTELERLSPDVVIPMHCSGAKFLAAMHRQMPDRLVTANIGSRFTFGV